MNELGPEARDLLDAAREADLPDEADRRRVRNALLAKIAAGTVVGASATAASSSAAAAGSVAVSSVAVSGGSAMLAVKIIAAVALVGGGVAVPAVVLRTDSPRTPHAASAPHRARETSPLPARAANAPVRSTQPVAPEAPVAPVEAVAPVPPSAPAPILAQPSVAPSVRNPMTTREPRLDVAQPRGSRATRQTQSEQTSIVAPRVTSDAPRTARSALAGEAASLESALTSIRDGHPEAAIAELDRHAEDHPDGVLAQERVAARIRALCALGRTGDADAARATFLRRWPTSPLTARVRAGCAR